jgi:hypothetical protein
MLRQFSDSLSSPLLSILQAKSVGSGFPFKRERHLIVDIARFPFLARKLGKSPEDTARD